MRFPKQGTRQRKEVSQNSVGLASLAAGIEIVSARLLSSPYSFRGTPAPIGSQFVQYLLWLVRLSLAASGAREDRRSVWSGLSTRYPHRSQAPVESSFAEYRSAVQ